MARRRGFFAELQHQNRLAAKRQAQQQRVAVREYNSAVLAQQRAASAHRRAADAAQRASAAQQVQLNKLAAAAYVTECEAEAVQRTAAATAQLQEIDELLAATLEVDDWVDLNDLRQSYEPAAFAPAAGLATPQSTPTYAPIPNQPYFAAPTPPSGISARFGGHGRYQTQLADAHTQFADSMATWLADFCDRCERNGAVRQGWRAIEHNRMVDLQKARSEHDAGNRQELKNVQTANTALNELIKQLGNKDRQAVEQYIGIVLANSTYPEAFEVEYDYEFQSEDRELAVTVLVPPPDRFPTVKTVRYVKAKDEFATSYLPAADVKRRYNAAVQQAALRTAHEVFEADRRKVIEAISLTVSVNTIDPATGHDVRVPLAQLAVDRETFLALELARVEPAQTLKHLSAAVSKNPFGLIPIAGQGVRG